MHLAPALAQPLAQEGLQGTQTLALVRRVEELLPAWPQLSVLWWQFSAVSGRRGGACVFRLYCIACS